MDLHIPAIPDDLQLVIGPRRESITMLMSISMPPMSSAAIPLLSSISRFCLTVKVAGQTRVYDKISAFNAHELL